MVHEQVRDILSSHGRLAAEVAQLSDHDDLYDAGLTSLNTVNLLLAIESHFDVEFPDDRLSRRTFQSIDSIARAIEGLTD